MTIRVAMLTDQLDQRGMALRAVLEDHPTPIRVRAISRAGTDAEHRRRSAAALTSGVLASSLQHQDGHAGSRSRRMLHRLPGGVMLQLLLHRPDLVIAEDCGAPALQAALYRRLSSRTRLLLCVTEPAPRLGLRERIIFGGADGVLAEDEMVAKAVERLRVPASRIIPFATPCDIEPFLDCGRARTGEAAHRLVFAGELTPQSGAADLLIAVAAWAEQHPDRRAEIWWIGEGDLAGVLAAQPLPAGLSQRFLGQLEPAGMAAAFAECGLLVVPSLADDRHTPVLEALAAGLPVIGSRRNRKARQFLRDGVNGWLFDPFAPGEMAAALGRALAASPEQLDAMRAVSGAAKQPAAALNLAERSRRAFAAVLPKLVLGPTPQSAA